MSDEKNKNRLFIVLQHRTRSGGGFHWSILLAPKSESGDMDERDSHLFHVINNFPPEAELVPGQPPDWRYENKPVNVLRSGSIVERALVAKLSGNEPLEEQAQRINAILRKVALVQHDKTWSCVTWVKNALDKLKAAGGEFQSIPVVTTNLEKEINAFAEKGVTSIIKAGKIITHPKDIPQLDLRGRKDEESKGDGNTGRPVVQ